MLVVPHLINRQVHLQLAVFLHLRRSCHLTPFVLCIEHAALWEKVINHNYLIGWQSPSHSSAHSFSPSLYPSIPHCPLSLFNFTRDQCCCQAIYLFRVVPQTRKGHRKPQLPCHKYDQPVWTSSPGLVPDSDRLLLMHVGNNLIWQRHTVFSLVNKLFFCVWLLDGVECE